MRLWREQNWRDYLPGFTCGWRDHEYAVGVSIGNRNCDPLVVVDLSFMPLWRDTGEAIQSALRDQTFKDYRAFGITWQMLARDYFAAISRMWDRRIEELLTAALGLGSPDQVIVDDPPLELRDDAE